MISCDKERIEGSLRGSWKWRLVYNTQMPNRQLRFSSTNGRHCGVGIKKPECLFVRNLQASEIATVELIDAYRCSSQAYCNALTIHLSHNQFVVNSDANAFNPY